MVCLGWYDPYLENCRNSEWSNHHMDNDLSCLPCLTHDMNSHFQSLCNILMWLCGLDHRHFMKHPEVKRLKTSWIFTSTQCHR